MKLIIFDKDKTVSYFGESKLQFIKTKSEKCLKFSLIDTDSEETLASSFDHIYIRKSNLLCCLGDRESNPAFISVFPNQEKCEQIYNAILKATSQQPLPAVSAANDDEVFKDIFYIPLLKSIQASTNGYQEMKDISLHFINSLEFEERLIYFNIMLEILLPPSIEMSSGANGDDMGFTSGADVAPTCETNFDSSGDTSLNDTVICRLRKRPYNNNDENEDESGRPKKFASGNLSLYDEPAPRNSPVDVIFDIVEFLHNGEPDKKLLIFTSAERKQCYEFIFIRGSNSFKCLQCFTQKKVTFVKYKLIDGGSKSFKFNIGQHICEPIDYLPSNYQSSLIIKPPSYKFIHRPWNGQMKHSLIIFDRDDKNLCYKFGYDASHKFYKCFPCRKRGLTFIARIIHHDGENRIELGHTQHACEPQKYIR